MSSRFAQSTLIYLGANIANAAVPFVLLPILTRVLSPTDYGAIAMFAISLGVFAALAGLSVHGAVGVRYFKLSAGDLDDFVTACLIILLGSSLALAGLVWLAGPWLEGLIDLPRDWLVAGVLVAAGQIVGQVRLSLWQMAGQPVRFGLFQVGQTLSNALFSLYLILGAGMAWQGRLGGQSLAVAGFGLLGLVLLWRQGFVVWPRNFRAHARDALGFGVPLIPHVLGGMMIVAADRLVITNRIDLASAGIYMVAVQIGQVLGLLTDSFNKAYAPWLMRQLSHHEDVPERRIVRGTYVYFAVVIGLALAIGAGAPVIVGLMAGEAFQAASTVVINVALGYAFSGCYLMVTNYIFFENRTAFLAYVTFATGLTHVALTYVLVGRFGIAGAGQAFLISQFLAFAGTWWLSQRVHPMPWRTALSH